MRGPAVLLVAGVIAGSVWLSVASRPPCEGAACTASCPRDADRVADRCACADQHRDRPRRLPSLPPKPTRSAGRRGRAGVGTAAASAPATTGEALDVASGACLPRGLVHGGISCGSDGAPVVEDGRAECVPAAAACPRGTSPKSELRRAWPPLCENTLAVPRGGRWRPRDGRQGTRGGPYVLAGRRAPGAARALTSTSARGSPSAIGPDGGLGTEASSAARIARRPAAFGVDPRPRARRLASGRRFSRFPTKDLTRLRATGSSRAEDAASGNALPPAAGDLRRPRVGRDLLAETLRGLGGGGERRLAAEVTVRCSVRSL